MIVGFLVLAIVLLLVLILLAILFPAVMRRLILGLICLVGIAYVVGSNLTEKSVQATNYRPSSIEAASPDPATNDVVYLSRGEDTSGMSDTECQQRYKMTCWLYRQATRQPEPDYHAKSAPQRTASDAESIIRRTCEAEWPNDFSMQSYCVRTQREAVRTLAERRPTIIAEPRLNIIRSKCAGEWPTDFAMRAYCEKQQIDGIRDLAR